MTHTLIPRWLPACAEGVVEDFHLLFISAKMIKEGEYVILKKDNVLKAVKLRKGR